MAFNINLNKSLGFVGIILGGVISLLVLAGFITPLFQSGASISENITTTPTGSTIGDTLADTLGPLVPVILVVAVVGLAFAAVQFARGK